MLVTIGYLCWAVSAVWHMTVRQLWSSCYSDLTAAEPITVAAFTVSSLQIMSTFRLVLYIMLMVKRFPVYSAKLAPYHCLAERPCQFPPLLHCYLLVPSQSTKQYWKNVRDLNNTRIIVRAIIEMHALWLVEDCVISFYNHPAWGDYSKGARFQIGCLAFCQCFGGIDKGDRRKLNC